MPEESYKNSISDNNPYETIMNGKEEPTFPYNLKEMAPLNDPYFEVLNRSPFGNTILVDLAIEALEARKLGKGSCTDLLQVSFSSTDAIGHTYGPQSKEINDTYVRLDREIARLLYNLDLHMGEGNYSVFLTADHGVGEVPKYLEDNNIPAGDLDQEALFNGAEEFLDEKLGQEKWILALRNDMFYLNHKVIEEKGLYLTPVQDLLASYILKQEGIFETYTATQLMKEEYTNYFGSKIQNGYNYKLSGDVKYIMNPGWYADLHTCATHNSVYVYDSHVPLLFYGKGFNQGISFEHYVIPDIAPTLSSLLKINFPSATTGKPIKEVLKKK
jgi:arylsulfatase A-like enzyme